MPKLPEVHFHLKPADADGYCLIYLQFLYSKERLHFSFGEKIKKTDWLKEKERAKNKAALTSDGEHLLNDLLENLKQVCETAYRKEKRNGVPTPEILKKHLKQFINRNLEEEQTADDGFYKLVERFISGEIKHKGEEKEENTLKSYKTTYNLLKQFEQETGYKITFDSINLNFYYKFIDYLSRPHTLMIKGKERVMDPLKPNTIGTRIKKIITFMNEAVDQELTTNIAFKNKKFVAPSEETFNVYLTENEIVDLYYHDFSYNKRLEQIRDLFVFGCFTGLRFSDYSVIQPENVVEHDGKTIIKNINKKTHFPTIIPSNPIILDIFRRYGNRSPKVISNQNFNDYIKEACEKAGLVEVGRKMNEPEKKLFECVTSHTCRRSFATNYYMQGVPISILMKITGHKTEKSFMKYIKMENMDAAKKLAEHVEKNWNWNQALRVA